MPHPVTHPSSQVCFDPELIRRYERNGPRYTSYPTAVEFHPACNAQQYGQAVAHSNQSNGTPLSIYVHIPFCTSPCFYCGCNKVITRDRTKAEIYLRYLYREIALQAALFDRTRAVEQLHFGGGTPTFLSLQQMQHLMTELQTHFNLSSTAGSREFSIEIDPRTLTPETLPTLAELGFNRLSLGVQDFDPEVQAAVNRVQSQQETLQAIDQARVNGFGSVSVDLIYGLPLQTREKFARTLGTVVQARPDRIAVYGYAHMPRMFKPQKQIVEAQLPSAAQRMELLGLTIETLTGAGYVYIGMDHFALPGDELVKAQQARSLHRNFQGYSTRAECDLIGLGVSSIGKVADTYVQNAKTLEEYYTALTANQLPIQRGIAMTRDDRIRHAVIQEIMCHGELRFAELSAALGIDFQRYFAAELQALHVLASDDLLAMDNNGLLATPKGRLLLRHIAMEFDAYLHKPREQTFSKAI
ncbi:MAG: oxygen-independent coproporphyrinogen III oxidase [Steroidobacteraceae bacterium]